MTKASRLRWQTAEVDASCAGLLRAALGLPRPMAALLAGRGHASPESARDFLNPRLSQLSDPFLLAGMEPAVARLLEALQARQAISVFGDYDADGITGTALLVGVLRRLGGVCTPFLPSRAAEGYGLTVGALSRCIDTQSPRLIVTVDCGTNSADAIRAAGARGVDVIVTDHHEVTDALPGAVALVNPKRGCPAAVESLAGVGVAFKLCHALLKRGLATKLPEADRVDLREWMDLVALGTVCDIVPLLGENRALVRHGMERLRAGGNCGLAALREVSRLEGRITSYHLGFMLGPRLNAAGRLGSAAPALELLLTSDGVRAGELALVLDEANRDRKRIEQKILEQAASGVGDRLDERGTFGIVAGCEGWDIGVLGLVASKLSQRHGRPAVVVTFDGQGRGRGSCRSVPGVDMVAALGHCREHLDAFGGHPMAAGLSLDKARFEDFGRDFNAYCSERLRGRDLRPVQVVDAWLDHLGEADWGLVESLQRLEPLGQGNPSPVWGARRVTVVGQPRRVGQDGAHLKMTVASGGACLDAIGFGLGPVELPDGPLDMLFELEENEFNGSKRIQLRVKDFREAEDPP